MAKQLNHPSLLITGISGFLGWHLAQVAPVQWQVYGTYHRRAIALPSITPCKLDLTVFDDLKQLFQDLRPTAVIHTAAQSKPNLCQTDPIASHAINVTATLHLADLCAAAQIPLVFTSTDLVFDGKTAPYRETDPVNPLSLYGEQKALAEQGILERHPVATICRMSLMFGAAPNTPSFLQDFLKILRSGQELRLFTDEFRTPVSGYTAARGLLLALEKQVSGRLHLGGRERLSRYDFGQLMLEAFDLPAAQILPTRQADLPMAAPRPADVSLDSSLAFGLGYSPGTVREEMEKVRDEG